MPQNLIYVNGNKQIIGRSGIYLMTCSVSQESYVGSSIDMYKRLCGHLRLLRRLKHHCAALQNRWDTHGESAFLFDVLEYVQEKRDLCIRERHWLGELMAMDKSLVLNTANKIPDIRYGPRNYSPNAGRVKKVDRFMDYALYEELIKKKYPCDMEVTQNRSHLRMRQNNMNEGNSA